MRKAITVDRVSKSFRIPRSQYQTLKERVLHPLAPREHDVIRAVRDMTFAVEEGEFFGIVGRNGSGKSTLLKCLAGIYEIDDGDVAIDGRLSPFIELGVGFNPDLAARDNVIINAIMLGLTRPEAVACFDDVIRFAELEQFVDLKLKNYSSGMAVRLGFASAIQVNADILLVDEVLAVGDAAFQRKCHHEFDRFKADGRTVIFVTHDMGAVERFCDRAMLLEKGRIVSIGEPEDIARQYNEINFGRWEGTDGERGAGPEHVQIRAAWVEDTRGERVTAIDQDARCRVAMEVHFVQPVEDPVFSFRVRNESRHIVFLASTDWTHGATGSFEAGQTAVVRVDFENWLAPARYTVTAVAAPAGRPEEPFDVREDIANLISSGSRFSGGAVDLPHHFEVTER